MSSLLLRKNTKVLFWCPCIDLNPSVLEWWIEVNIWASKQAVSVILQPWLHPAPWENHDLCADKWAWVYMPLTPPQSHMQPRPSYHTEGMKQHVCVQKGGQWKREYIALPLPPHKGRGRWVACHLCLSFSLTHTHTSIVCAYCHPMLSLPMTPTTPPFP